MTPASQVPDRLLEAKGSVGRWAKKRMRELEAEARAALAAQRAEEAARSELKQC